MILKTISISNIFCIIFILYFTSTNAKTVEQYYIKITPNVPTVDCGKLKITKLKTEQISFVGKDIDSNVEVKKALAILNDSILLKHKADSKIVFFMHGFWASLPYAINRTAKGFKTNYFKKDSLNVVAIIHVLWEANGVLYKHSLENLKNSTSTLSEIFNNLNPNMVFKKSLMSHSMGNRFLYQTLLNEENNVLFENLLLLAPDLDYRKFEENHKLFTSIAKTVDVFYHEKDNTLNMSKGINKVERLGRLNKSEIEKNINFIDCTSIDDINTFSDSIMKHLYFITSKTVISRIEEILMP